MSEKFTPAYIDEHLTLGADPEFLLLNKSGRSVSGDGIRGLCGGTNARFGVDGGGCAMELRPSPSTNPIQVVKSIELTLKSGLRNHPSTRQYKWVGGGSCEQPIGGHIHFGTHALRAPEYPKPGGHTNISVLARDLDLFLALPVLAIEKKEEAIARRATGYGRLSDMRSQPWGCEYRTLGSWVTSPAVALAVLSLAKVVACESLAGQIAGAERVGVPNEQFIRAMVAPAITAKAWERIEKMALFPKYKKDIELIRELAAKGQTWHAGDLKATWKAMTPKMVAVIKRTEAEAAEAIAKATKLSSIWTGVRPKLYTVRRQAVAEVTL